MADPAVVLCFGDSNTYGVDGADGSGRRLAYGNRWTTVLGERLGRGFLVVPEGLNGRTTVLDDPAGSEAMLMPEGLNGRRYLLPCLHSHKPVSVFVLALGCNDLKQKHYFGPHDVVSGLRALVADVRSSSTGPHPGCPPAVVVVSPPALRDSAANVKWGFADCDKRSRETIAALAAACEEDGLRHVDLSAVAVVAADGIHFGAEAAEPIAAAVAQAVKGAYRDLEAAGAVPALPPEPQSLAGLMAAGVVTVQKDS